MVKTAVIGASGFIGRQFLRRYRSRYPDCIGTAFSNVNDALTSFDLRSPEIDRLNLHATEHQAVLIASAKPDVSWCEAHKKESYALNVTGTLKCVEQLAKEAITILFLSSDYVFDGKDGHYSDRSPLSPCTEYGRQKAEVEREIPNLTQDYLILRLSKIYGTTWKDHTLLDEIAENLFEGRPVMAAPDQFFTPTHVDDVVAMTLALQDQGARGLINLCNKNIYSRHEIAVSVAKAMQADLSLIKPTPLHAIPGLSQRPLNTSLLSSTILDYLQPQLHPLDESIKQVAKNWHNARFYAHSKPA